MLNMKTIKGLLLAGMIGLTGLLAGCGGGGAGTTPTGGTTASAITALSLVSATDGQATTTVTPSQPAKVVITTTATDLITLVTTVGTLSKTAVLPVNGKAEVLLTVAITDTNDGVLTATLANGSSKTLAFTVGQTNLSLGSGTPFVAGRVALGLTQISAGGTVQVTADLVDSSTSQLFTQPANVAFSSPCVSNGRAQIGTPVTTVNGRAVTTYRDINCGQNDVITATASVGGQVLTASATLNVLPPTVGSIQYVSATPSNIGLKGSGGVETAQVVFKVFDTNGNPLSGQVVNFTLNTGIGGLFLTQTTVQTDSQGLARAVVNAGTVSSAVRVTATIKDTGLATQSSQLYVSTGLPEQRRFSIAVQQHNLECFNVDGVTSTVTASLADHFGNLAPDNTAVQFRTEYGAITAACTTVNGVCVATWRSQGDRGNGRSTLLATAIGEESFDDVNPSNGLFDATETFNPANDLPEAWLDSNENGVRDASEEYLDFSNIVSTIPAYDPKDGKYNGAACDPALNTQCSSTQRSLHVRAENLIICSTSGALITAVPDPVPTVPAGSSTAVTFSVTDLKGNPMAAGTVIACSTTNGTLEGTTSFTMPDMTSGAYSNVCTIKADTTPSTGRLTIKVTSTKGLITEKFFEVKD